MRSAAIPGRAGASLHVPAKAFDNAKDVIGDPFSWAPLSSPFVCILCFLPVLALLAGFLFASFWLASGILLVVGTIGAGWLGVLAAMLAFDCVPEGGLRGGPFGPAPGNPRRASGAEAAREFGGSLNFSFCPICVAVLWVLALVIAAIAVRLFLF